MLLKESSSLWRSMLSNCLFQAWDIVSRVSDFYQLHDGNARENDEYHGQKKQLFLLLQSSSNESRPWKSSLKSLASADARSRSLLSSSPMFQTKLETKTRARSQTGKSRHRGRGPLEWSWLACRKSVVGSSEIWAGRRKKRSKKTQDRCKPSHKREISHVNPGDAFGRRHATRMRQREHPAWSGRASQIKHVPSSYAVARDEE